jgi:hypothetical protein
MHRARRAFLALTVIISGAVYWATRCPTVELIDSGELALAAKNLGIAHPTGYPLYTLLGRIFAILPFGELIFRVNLLSLLFTASATGFLYLLISEFISSDQPGFIKEAISSAGALFVGFSPVWWAQGTTNEVYSLNLLLISISIWSLAKFISEKSYRWLVLSLYTLGLSLANHLSAVYLIPGFLYLIIVTLKKARLGRSFVNRMIMFFVFPGSLYAVLPIRACFKPFLNWGGVNDPYFFYKHITGWQYRVWMFDRPLGQLAAGLGPAVKLFLGQFGWIGAILIGLGIVICARRQRRLLIFAILTWLVNLVYVLNYKISDIESYYLPMFLMSAIFLTIGALYLFELFIKQFGKSKAVAWVLAVVSFILPLYNLTSNFNKADSSGKTAARQGVMDIAGAMEQGGLILVENWDFYSPWLYFHFEKNFRPDLVFLDKELMRRSWYIDFIKRNHNDIYERSKSEFEVFLQQVGPFERGKPYNSQVIDNAYYGMLHAIIKNESARRAVYTNIVDDNRLIGDMIPTPDGLLIKFTPTESLVEAPRAEFDEAYWRTQTKYDPQRIAYLLSFYARVFELRGKYCRYYQQPDESSYYLNLSNRVKAVMGH